MKPLLLKAEPNLAYEANDSIIVHASLLTAEPNPAHDLIIIVPETSVRANFAIEFGEFGPRGLQTAKLFQFFPC